jgi:hypothetical protein
MNPTELIIEYINGDLPIDAESEFYSKLSINQSLRDELRMYKLIPKAAKSSLNAFVPDVNLTNSLFTSLGIAASSHNTPLNINKNSNLIQNSKMMLVGGIIVFLLLSPFYYFFGNKGNIVIEDKVPVIIKSASSIPIEKPINIQQKSKPIIKYVFIEKEKDIDKVDQNNIIRNLNTINFVKKDKNIKINQVVSDFNSPNIRQESIPEFIESTNILEDWGLAIEMKSTANWTLPKETLFPSYMSKINNMDLAILYKLNDNFQIGADFRHETFFVKYRGLNSLNQTIDYEQNPNLYSYGIFGRYNIGEFSNINPFLQGMFSANNYGIILRSSLGLEYRILPQFGITAQAEYSTMNYQHQNNKFNAGKFSINYGIKYSL